MRCDASWEILKLIINVESRGARKGGGGKSGCSLKERVRRKKRKCLEDLKKKEQVRKNKVCREQKERM